MTAASLTARSRKGSGVVRRPNLGVYRDRLSLDIEPRGLEDCRNVRIKDGKLLNDGLGWENFPLLASDTDRINLDSRQVLLIDRHRTRAGAVTTIFANQKDIFRFNPAAGPPATVTYLTPRYQTGTVGNATGPNTRIDGSGTAWDTDIVTAPVTNGYGKNAKQGYYIAFGAIDEVALDATWYQIDSVPSDTRLDLLVDPGTITPGTAYTIRQTMTGDNLDIWETATFQNSQDSAPLGLDVYYVTNGVEMMSWDGSDDQVAWFYPGFVGKNLIFMQQTLAFWNIVDAAGNTLPGSIYYSLLNHPEDFTSDGSGTILPSDGVLDLLAGVPLGDQIVCYYQGDIILLQQVPEPVYWASRVAVPGIGLVAQRAVQDHGDYHEFLSRAGAYRFDGVALTPAMPQLLRDVLATAAPNRIRQAYSAIDEENGEVLWVVPLITDGQDDDEPPTTAYSQHYLEDVGSSLPTPMMIRDFPFTAVGFYESTGNLKFDDIPRTSAGTFAASALQWDDRALHQAFPLKIAGDANGDIYVLNTANMQAGGRILSYVDFPRSALVDGEQIGLVHQIQPYTTRRQGASGYPLRIRLSLYDFADGDAVANHLFEFDLTHSGRRFVPVRKAGRYGAVRFFSLGEAIGRVAQAEPWDLGGYRVRVSAMGER